MKPSYNPEDLNSSQHRFIKTFDGLLIHCCKTVVFEPITRLNPLKNTLKSYLEFQKECGVILDYNLVVNNEYVRANVQITTLVNHLFAFDFRLNS